MSSGRTPGDPTDYDALPPVNGSVLAYRMVDTYDQRRGPFPRVKVFNLALAVCFFAFFEKLTRDSGGGDFFPNLARLGIMVCVVWVGVVLIKHLRSVVWVRRFHPPLEKLFRSWEAITTALMNSPYVVRWKEGVVRERDHLFVGTIEGTQKVLLLANDLLMTHVHVLGASRGGKTHRFLLPLLTQLIRRKKHSLVFLDMKGGREVLFGLGIEARRAGLNFRWFSLEHRKSGYVFNFFLQRLYPVLSVNERVQILLQALAIDAGEGHGVGYFSAVQERLVNALLRLNPEINSFRALFEFMTRPGIGLMVGMSQRDIENATYVVAVLSRLDSQAMNATAMDTPRSAIEAGIDLYDILSQPGVIYAGLTMNLEPTTARIFARLVIQSLVAAARVYEGKRVDVVVVIDEFDQILTTPNFLTLLKQARDAHISFWMCHQEMSDLSRGPVDFGGSVTGNSSVKIVFSAKNDQGRNNLLNSGGETIRVLRGHTTTAGVTPNGQTFGTSIQKHETIVPRIDQNVINRLNRDESLALIDVSPGVGFTQLKHPVLVRTAFHINEREFRRRAALPWPRPNAFTVGGDVENDPPGGPPEESPTAGPNAGAPGGPSHAVEVPLPEPCEAEAPSEAEVTTPAVSEEPQARRQRKPRRRAAREPAAVGERPAESPASARAEEMADYLRSILDEQRIPGERP